ncbi:MAG: phosphonate metabolism protein/1,5-bisphosphokinase (PRPP-forming) PhnN [Promethearchaeota archaeon Loki_b31]|nr:MAG: phosphonate metabolism protein/1,5-bisphosphokinase (PRPP-forming) PhnN [Candidatus Lokiarchaeota archaeon Loki_b31]
MKKVFSGTLFLVVGNSGSGKDSIIKAVLERYPSDLKSIRLTQRYITRPPSENEENISTSPKEFRKMSKQGKFALEWHIYGLDYGVPIEIDSWLKKGHPMLVNVSRTIVKKACQIYRNLKIVFIEVPFEITLKRLKARARESGKRLEERIERAKKNQKFSDADFIVDNSEELENAVNQFLNYVISVVKGK